MLLTAVRQFIRRHALIPHGSRVAVALSGGSDSMALLHALVAIAPDENFEVAGIVHLNHLLRDRDADADEAFCREVAAGLTLPADVERTDIRGLAAARGVSIEHAAHDERHAFFARAALRLGATCVAVAHTRDDQAETFLLRLLRGAGPRGLGGIHVRSGIVVRPLLDSSREEVRRFVADRDIPFRDDASNADCEILRNRIRHELLPLLRDRFSPGIVDVLEREAAIARDDAEFLDAAAEEAVARLIDRRDAAVHLRASSLLALPPAIARRVVRRAQQMAAGVFVGFDAVETVLAFAVSKATGPIDLPGHTIHRVDDAVIFSPRAGRGQRRGPAGFSYRLEVPGRVVVPEAACAISADALDELRPQHCQLVNRGDEVVIEARAVTRPLEVRSRRAGDELRPLGLGGRKKLQDLFVDAKIARDERDRTPVVVDGNGRILWVAGLGISDEFRVTDRTTAVVILKREIIR